MTKPIRNHNRSSPDFKTQWLTLEYKFKSRRFDYDIVDGFVEAANYVYQNNEGQLQKSWWPDQESLK